MPPAPTPHPDVLGAFLRRLAVLLADLLGAVINSLVAERDSLPPLHPLRPVLSAHIATYRRLLARWAADLATSPIPVIASPICAPRLVCAGPAPRPARARPHPHPLRRTTRPRQGRPPAPRAIHPRPLHPPNRRAVASHP